MNEEKVINEARDYHKNNPKKSVYDYLSSSDSFNKLNKFQKKHVIKQLAKQYGDDVDSINLWNELQ